MVSRKTPKSRGASWRLCGPWWCWCNAHTCQMLCTWTWNGVRRGTCWITDFWGCKQRKRGSTAFDETYQWSEREKQHWPEGLVLCSLKEDGRLIWRLSQHKSRVNWRLREFAFWWTSFHGIKSIWDVRFHNTHMKKKTIANKTCLMNTCWIPLTANNIGDTGVTSLSEALKSNTALTELNLFS